MGIEMEGFDDAQNQLNEMAEKAKELDGENEVPLADLCNSFFMKENTSYSSFEELLEDGGYEVESSEDFEAIPEGEFDNHIRQNTSFNSWEEMLSTAGQAWVTSEMGLD